MFSELSQEDKVELTHGEKAPGDSRGGEAGEHIVGAAEVGEVWKDHRLAPALAPHVHMPTLALGGRCVGRVTGCNLYDSKVTSKYHRDTLLTGGQELASPSADALDLDCVD